MKRSGMLELKPGLEGGGPQASLSSNLLGGGGGKDLCRQRQGE